MGHDEETRLITPALFSPPKRRRMNLEAVCLNIVLPWLIFCMLDLAMTFSLHHLYPIIAYISVGLGCCCVLFSGYLAYIAKMQQGESTWFTFLTLALLLAVVASTSIGSTNYWHNLKPYYDLESLGVYPAVDPFRERGQAFMDSGRMYFTSGSRLDLKKTIAFKNDDIYCVAPIINGDVQPDSYDFWAVGVNCCNSTTSNFYCGEFKNPHARAGTRLMREDQRPFFRLAVQQAEAAYTINSTHPLFFIWVQDPIVEMNSYRDDGYKYFMLGMIVHFLVNTFLVVIVAISFSKIGQF